jgi:hypothetical protein
MDEENVCGVTGTQEHSDECQYLGNDMWDCGKLDNPAPEWDAHRRNPDFCAKCGGQCYFDSNGVRIVANQGGWA